MKTHPSIQKVRMFGISIDNLSLKEAVDEIDRLAASGEKHFVVTPNVDHVVRLHQDSEFQSVYRKASLVVADGTPLIWASRFFGEPLKERVAGSDLVLPVCRMASEKNYSLYFLGSEPGVGERAAECLRKLMPSIKIIGTYGPPFGFESDENENSKIVKEINRLKPDILFVALGAPKQEKWLSKYLSEINIKMGICVGAGIDFIAGAARRAPKWTHGVGLEWVWRLFHDPARLWKRYLVQDAAFLGIFMKEWRERRKAGRSAKPAVWETK